MYSEFSMHLFTSQDVYGKNKFAFYSSHEDWNQNWVLVMEFSILAHVLFPRNLEEIDAMLLFQVQIVQGPLSLSF